MKGENLRSRPEKFWLGEYHDYLVIEKNFSQHTIEAYLRDIGQFLNYLEENGIEEVDQKVVYAWLHESFPLRRGQKEKKILRTSQARKIASLRSFYQFLYRRGFLEKNPLRYVRSPKSGKNLPRPVLPLDMVRLLENETQQNKYLQIRDIALLELCYSTGMRISEALSIKKSDIIFEEKIVSELKVLGKGKKERIVFIGKKAQEALLRYLSIRPFLVGEKDCEALFVNAKGGPLTRVGAAFILRQRKQYLAIQKDYTPHSFRHAFATDLLDAGADIRHVQEMLGHKSISTTQRYLAVAKERLMNIYRTCHPHGKKILSTAPKELDTET